MTGVEGLAVAATQEPQDRVFARRTNLGMGEGSPGLLGRFPRPFPATPSAQPAHSVVRLDHLGSEMTRSSGPGSATERGGSGKAVLGYYSMLQGSTVVPICTEECRRSVAVGRGPRRHSP